MTIIHISSSLGGGGAEQMVYQLANQSHAKIRTIVFAISNDNALEYKFKDSGIEYYFLAINSFKNSSLLRGLKTLNHKIKDLSDVVFHGHQFHGALLALLYNRLYSKIPIVFTLHSSTIESKARKLLLNLTKPLRKFDVIFSKNASQWYLKNNAVIPNGIDLGDLSIETKRNFTKNEKFSFLFLGRLSKEKNPLFMIEAAQYLKNNGVTNFVINVVGDGVMRDQLIEAINDLELTEHFNLFGFQKNIKQFLRNAHCLILPSHWEGMPVVLLEAAAAKLPIIATAVGSIPDFLNNSNASIASLTDFPKAMKNNFQNYNDAVLKSNALYEEIKTVFNIEKVYESHLRLYESLV